MEQGNMEEKLFQMQLSGELEAFIRGINPWWQDQPMKPLPRFRRWLFEHVLQRLRSGLAPVVVLRGPRQVGKTTLQEQLIEYLLNTESVDPRRILRVQFDDLPPFKKLESPILSLCNWYEHVVLGASFNEMAKRSEKVFLFFDEVQNLGDWAPQVKALVDHFSVAVCITGSSALRIEQGRDSLAGRITTLELGTLLIREIAEMHDPESRIHPMISTNGLGEMKDKEFWVELGQLGLREKTVRDAAFEKFSERGGYPVSQARLDRPWPEVSDQLNETVIRRVIQHDLRLGERGRKRDQKLLEELFLLCCRYAGQAPGQALYINELHSALAANIGWQRVLNYLQFLNDTLLMRLIQPLELRLKRKKGQPKVCLCDHSLRASWLQEIIPLTPKGLDEFPHLSDLAGHIAESVAGYFLSSIPDLDVAWFPERGAEPEVDFVLTIGETRIPLEVKYRRHIDAQRDTVGLRAFIEKTVYNAPFGVLVSLNDDIRVTDPRIVQLPLASLLLLR